MINVSKLDEVWSRHLVDRGPQFSRSHLRSSVFDHVAFDELDDAAKCRLAARLLLDVTPAIGGFGGNADTFCYFRHAAQEFRSWPCGKGYASRRLDSIAYAFDVLAEFDSLSKPPRALAASHLLLQLEFLFRVLSAHLNDDGTFRSPAHKAGAEQQLSQSFGTRINRVEQTYRIMLLNTTVAATTFRLLDATMRAVPVGAGETISTIGERIEYLRHDVAHGPLADPSFEGPFYALLVAIAAYGSTVFDRT